MVPEDKNAILERAARQLLSGYTVILEGAQQYDNQQAASSSATGSYHDTLIPPPDQASHPPANQYAGPYTDPVPEKIIHMRRLYQYSNQSFQKKCENFYRQGKFMEDYEDDQPWTGKFRHYFPTYHDLNVRQLRGYFTWRTAVRKGEYHPTSLSFAYIYLYELLCGIGVSSPEESLQKMKQFQQNFLEPDFGDSKMEHNLKNWMLEFSVIHNLSPEKTRKNADEQLLQTDEALAVLRRPEDYTDEEIFTALCVVDKNKLRKSSAFKKYPDKTQKFFAALWRENNFFTSCFDEPRTYPWYPLNNAVYYEEKPHEDCVYELDPCRTFTCKEGKWTVTKYAAVFYNQTFLNGLLREADRIIRKFLKSGHYLQPKMDHSWATPVVEAAIDNCIAEERQKEEEARRISIDFSGLDQIRKDASETRDSLLIDEEPEPEPEPEPQQQTDPEVPGLDPRYTKILAMLLRGEDPGSYIKENHLMPSIVADAVNEALFDDIGDSVLESDGNNLTLIDDYREDIVDILGGSNS